MTCYEYLAIPEYQFDDKPPEKGTTVCFLIGKPRRLWCGKVVTIKGTWAVKTPEGKIFHPYLSDVLKPGCELKPIKSTIIFDT